MTRDELVNIVLARCERREDDTALRTLVEAEMRLVQEGVLEQRVDLPWFLQTEEANATTTAHEERVDLPSDFLLQEDEQGLYIQLPDSGVWKLLEKREYDYLQHRFGTTENVPQAYALTGTYFVLRPIPDTIYPVKMVYYGRDSWPGSTEANKWMAYAPNVVVAETGIVIAGEYLHNDTLMVKFQAQAEKAWAELASRNLQHRINARSVVMGGNTL